VELSIIIVNWNSACFVRECLRSIRRHASEFSYEVIVIDNASFDGCDKVLREETPEGIYLQSDTNLGFAKANNRAFQISHGENLLFLNPDTELVGSAIPSLLKALQLPQAGAAGARLLNSDGSLQMSCIQSFPTVLNQVLDSDFFRAHFPRSSLWGTKAFYSPSRQPEIVEVISGACLMVKRSVFEAVGGFTEKYFMYSEDLDLCFKIRRAGYRAYYQPEAEVVHHGGTSTSQAKSNFSNVMMRESVYRFLRLNQGALSAALYRAGMTGTAILRLLCALPASVFAGRRIVRHGAGSFRKWRAILRWSLGLEPWTRNSGEDAMRLDHPAHSG